MPFSSSQIEQLEAHGITIEEAERQLGLLREPPSPAALRRPCTIGDGLCQLDEAERHRLAEVWAAHRDVAPDRFRVLKFVPASGAATRMFKSLHALRARRTPETFNELRTAAERGDTDARLVVDLLGQIEDMAICGPLGEALGQPPSEILARGAYLRLIDGMLSQESGLGLSALPKGLIPFHLYDDGPRTAIEEHLLEGLGYLYADRARAFHFTVSPPHREMFEAVASEAVRKHAEHGVELDVRFSIQNPSTDTIAIDELREPLVGNDGRLVFRPAGHGALLENLAQLDADVVFIKNIDNVVPERAQAETIAWKQSLAGLAVETQGRICAELDVLERGSVDLARVWQFVDETLTIEPPAGIRARPEDEQRRYLVERLDRPLRVCGMVRNEGEPGGGPFWVAGRGGEITPQIVESAQVDHQIDAQAEIWSRSTHFNPVDLVCCLKQPNGRAFDLAEHCDASTSFVTTKSYDGHPITVLERPGLWNGSMAGWNTLFVEVPIATFAPVKTILDLLKPQHRPDRRPARHEPRS